MFRKICKNCEETDKWFYYKRGDCISMKQEHNVFDLYFYNGEYWIDCSAPLRELECEVCISKASELIENNDEAKCEKCDDIFRWYYYVYEGIERIMFTEEEGSVIELIRNENGTWIDENFGLEWECVNCITSANSLMINKIFYNIFLFRESGIVLKHFPSDILKLIVKIYFGYK